MTMRRRVVLVRLISVIGMVAVLALQFGPNRHRMEDDLTRRSVRALTEAGGPPVEVAFTGRDGVLRAGDEATANRAREIVARLEGVRAVRTVVPPVSVPVRPPAPNLRVAITHGRVAITGTVPAGTGRALIRDALDGFAATDDRVTAGEVTGDGLAGIPGLLGALPRQSEDLTVELRDGALTLSGTAGSETEWVAVTAAARATGLPLVERLGVADLGARLADVPPLLFPDGSAWLSPQAQRNLWRTAGLLNAYPSASVRIEGHTDAFEAGDPLSEERATAVRDVLVSFGIDGDRLTTNGLAHDRPDRPDDTDDGRALNRRAELVVTGQLSP
ncbi:outer membrane protein OmpA-like peptidoglycan-associated protein [Catenuloplanes nepalensis]|uniref:Outer membrane protein OmpA-like peptidoglycan-associated protein n=1 Tax=Catenuloplanes nepalensis TaxID=587533 RepID=A0ABT9MMT9_9ACTN|nr:OmpA family protein [Catenuloplanes nepalensis]MDP9792735.1 outer membrane protein OmpA-like peptidoglycan-associated protein [Catenuloplanes nepalensis]